MAHLDHWSPKLDLSISQDEVQEVKNDLNRFFWAWYEAHKDDVIFRFMFWTWTVEDLMYDLFVKLFGRPRTL